MKKRLLSMLLTVSMILSMLPMGAFAAEAHVHTEECDHAEDAAQVVCTCETDHPDWHAPFCDAYVAPEDPQCYCVEVCGDFVNDYCDVCYFDAAACAASGEEEAALFAAAPTYIASIGIDQDGSTGSTGINDCKAALTGHTIIDRDLNDGAGGDYVYMGYKTTTDPSQAITGIVFRVGENPPASITYNGYTFNLVGGSKESNTAKEGGWIDLNGAAGGDYIYMYVTRDSGYGAPLISMTVSENESESGYTAGTNTSGAVIDLNQNAGGDYLYLHYKRATVLNPSVFFYTILDGVFNTTSDRVNTTMYDNYNKFTPKFDFVKNPTSGGLSYQFVGWREDRQALAPTVTTISLTADQCPKYFYAVYTNEVSLTFDANGGTGAPSTVKGTQFVSTNTSSAVPPGSTAYIYPFTHGGVSIKIPEQVPTKSGACVFSHWNRSGDGKDLHPGETITWYFPSTLTAAYQNHSYVNGICTACGIDICSHNYNENGFCNCTEGQIHYQPAELKNDYYQIKNGGNLFWFAQQVNAHGNREIKGILTANIDLENRAWTPIGSTGETNNNFRGHFNGNGKTITGLNVQGGRSGLGFFGEVRLGTVENFTIHGEVTLTGNHGYVGGVIGSAPGVNSDKPEHNGATIRNITSYVNVTLGEGSHGASRVGGFIGYANHATLIENCAWYGTLDLGPYRAQDGVGGLLGKANDSSAVTIRNCGAYGTIKTSYQSGSYNSFDTIFIGGIVSNSVDSAKTVIENTLWAGTIVNNTNLASDKAQIAAFGTLNGIGSVTNCYALAGSAPYLTTNGTHDSYITTKTAEELKSGEVAYLLQDAQDTQIWGQTIGTNDYPILGGAKVYPIKNCKDEIINYSNTDAPLVHFWSDNGFCTVCDAYEPAQLVDGAYQIGNAGQLYWFAQQVNDGQTSINGKLTANITVNTNVLAEDGTLNEGTFRAWTPIGNSNRNYAGTFDGDGKTVSGLYFENKNTDYVGLFGYVNGGTVKNVGVIVSYLYGDSDVGGVVGHNSGGTVSNCCNTGAVSGIYEVGGVVGQNYGSVSNCYNTGTVSGTANNNVGGVVGYNGSSGTVSNCYNTGDVSSKWHNVGGVVGENYKGTVSNCYNTGTVSGKHYVGGMVGYNTSSGTVSNCYNTGTVSGRSYVGGVVGYNTGSGTVSNCYNTGAVSGEENNVGGVVGYNTSSGTVSNCYNTGAVSGSSDFVGGVVGQNNGTVSNCYYDSMVYTGDAIGGSEGETIVTNVEGKTTQQFTSGEVAYLLQGAQKTQIWGQKLEGEGDKDAYPVFSDARVYEVLKCDGTLDSYSNTKNLPTVHSYDNGFCTNCNAYEPAQLVDDYYQIGNAGQLYWFAQQVNENRQASIKGKLTADIVVNENVLKEDGTPNEGPFRAWTPIANYSNNSMKYTGTFDGDDHTVSGLYFNNTSANYVGLFGYVNGGTVKNVGVIDSYISGNYYVGGVVGQNNGTVSDCSNTGAVSGSSDYVGGVVGQNNDSGSVSGCSNTGDVSGSYEVGGVVGDNYGSGSVSGCSNTGDVSGSYEVGGVVGDNYGSGSVSDCSNSGTISGSSDVGGVVGRNYGGTVSKCHNTGTIFGSSNYVGGVAGDNYGSVSGCSNTGAVSGSSYVGGVVGENNSSGSVSGCSNTGDVSGSLYVGGVVGASTGSVSSCHNTGAVSGSDSVGGVVGINNGGTVSDCYNTGTVSGSSEYVGGAVGYNSGSGTVSNCYNTGTVSGSSHVGGVVGEDHGTVSDCYNTGAVSGSSNYVGGVVGGNYGTVSNCYYLDTCGALGKGTSKTAAQFASGEVAYLLNGDQNDIVFKQTLGTDDYPNFTGAPVYQVTCVDTTFYSNSSLNYTAHSFVDDVCVNCGTLNCDHSGNTNKHTDCTKDLICSVCNTIITPAASHSGGTATCTNPAICSVCGLSYGAVDPSNHDFTDNGFCTDCNGFEPAQLVDDYYQIGNAGQLYWFAQQVNEKGQTSINGKLTADITVNTNVLTEDGTLNTGTFRNWTPIGNSSEKYAGIFDGDGKTVSGLYFNNSSTIYVGLFGYVNGGTVKNVGVIDSYISGNYYMGGVVGWNEGTVSDCYNTGAVSGEMYVGGVVGYNNTNGTVYDCYNTGAVSGSSNYVGGVVGASTGSVSNCYNTGTVSGSRDYVGGVVGRNYGTVSDCCNTGAVSCEGSHVGGVVGYNNTNGTVSNCCNSGTISGKYCVGGMVGVNESNGTVSNGYNTGAVSCKGSHVGGVAGISHGTVSKCHNTGDVSGSGEHVGGVVGAHEPNGTVSDCYNTGAVSGSYYVGGVVGDNYGTVSNCYNTGTISGSSDYVGGVVGENYGTVSNGYNSGMVSGSDYVGGVAGYNNSSVSNFYNTGAVSGSYYVGGVVGYNSGTVSDCYNTGTASGSTDHVGGVVGYNSGTVSNCYNTGAVSGSYFVGGAVGSNSGTGSVSNCYNTGTVSGSAYVGGVVGDNYGAVSNCYYLDTCGASGEGTSKTAAQFKSGEVAYLLNGDQNAIVFKQTLSTDDYPNFTGAPVYLVTCVDIACYSNSNMNYEEHSFVDNVCVNCGTPNCDHSGNTNKHTDCTEDLICSVCDTIITPAAESHSGGTATCTNPAICSVCGLSYGAVDPSSHDFTDNGFCPNCDAYEPAQLVDETYQIGNAGQLYWFAQQVNEKGQASIKGKLTADITVNTNVLKEDGTLNEDTFRIWTPIGNNGRQYRGTFDGNGKTVSGLYFNNSSTEPVGLFGYVNGGTVQNVGVVDSYISGSDSVGGVVGSNNYGTVSNCHNTGTVSGSYNAGGVVGYNKTDSTVSNCYNTGTVSGIDSVGGVVGQDYGTVSKCHNTGAVSGETSVGGVVGYNGSSCTVSDCYNTGAVSGEASVGGVVGDNRGTVSKCHNTGTISGFREVSGVVGRSYDIVIDCYNTGAVSGSYYVGGVVGYNNGSGSVSDCYNTGTVSSIDSVGGVVGDNYGGTVSGCYNSGDVSGSGEYVGGVVGANEPNGTVSDCYNTGAVSSYSEVGGVVGYNGSSCNVSSCYNTGAVSGEENYVGGVVGQDYGTVSDCCNTGTVSGYSYVGGVVGQDYGTVSDCYNTGTVSGSSNYVGGVVGEDYGTVSNCYNTGDVSGSDSVGGVVGEDYGTVSNCYNTGAVSGSSYVGGVVGWNGTDSTVSNCYNTGAISGSKHVGGVVGYKTSSSTVSNCYYDNTIYSGSAIGTSKGTVTDVLGKTTQQFASGEVAYLLNGDQSDIVFKQTLGADDYPNFTGEPVYQVTCGGTGTLYSNAQENVESHTPATDDGDCTTPIICAHCQAVVVAANSSHTPGTDDGDCTTPVSCINCDQIATPAISHNFSVEVATTPATCAKTGTRTMKCSSCNQTTDLTLPIDPENHDMQQTAAKVEPTCEGEGKEAVLTCANGCGKTEGGAPIAATGHDWNEGVVTAAPNCTEPGKMTYTCKKDPAHTKVTDIPSTGHADANGDYICDTCSTKLCTEHTTATREENRVEATCEVPGSYNLVTYCIKCGDVLSTESKTIAATGHADANGDYICDTCSTKLCTAHTTATREENRVEATCEQDGSYNLVTYCTKCGDVISTESKTIPSTGHDMQQTAAKVEPTCEGEGKEAVLTCANGCGKTEGGQTIAATGHDWNEGVVTAAPTCTEPGKMTYTCEKDPAHTKVTDISATGHADANGDYVCDTCSTKLCTEHTTATREENRVEATCEVPGSYNLVTYCTKCGDVISTESKTIPATGHDMQQTAAKVEPTCEGEGKEAVLTCANGCGKTEGGAPIAATGHGWNEGVVSKQPTETEAGEKTYTCEICGDTKAESIPALGHTHSYTAAVTEPTCTEDGYTTYTCSCGNSYQANFVTATGHSYVNGFVWQSDFSTAEATATCGNCGDIQSKTCAVTCIWDAGTAKLIFTAAAEVNGETVTDEQYIQLLRDGKNLIITNSAAQAEDRVAMTLMIAGYNGGRMTGCQMVKTVTGVEAIDLKVSGTLKIFFLSPGTYAPLFVSAELQ